MGRLGFNLLRQKEANKNVNVNVETGAPVPDQQQNERNETVEMSELILALEERDKMISTLRYMLLTTTAMIFCVTAYIFLTQARSACDIKAATPVIDNKMDIQPETLAASLAGEFDALKAARFNEEAVNNCTQQLETIRQTNAELQRSLENEHMERLQESVMAKQENFKLKDELETLRAEHEALITQSRQKEENINNLKDEVKKLEDERSRVKLARSQRQRPPVTTTKSPFESEQFKKINDLVKNIETGSAIFDMDGFMKKADEIFNINH